MSKRLGPHITKVELMMFYGLVEGRAPSSIDNPTRFHDWFIRQMDKLRGDVDYGEIAMNQEIHITEKIKMFAQKLIELNPETAAIRNLDMDRVGLLQELGTAAAPTIYTRHWNLMRDNNLTIIEALIFTVFWNANRGDGLDWKRNEVERIKQIKRRAKLQREIDLDQEMINMHNDNIARLKQDIAEIERRFEGEDWSFEYDVVS